ncbi:MAG: host-nuclease inhibitor Gam family protein [Clostridium sp.]|uniref:host-nuclease inhibitor Gam family protein n=1 Tax=Clostridium sp. TaxID=1506 RepID=UPI0028FDC4F8|nr:host-nuclease inhibitor Gam family protein [Clostridium sp.]MDU1279170.1 host-nuclease inhibitor Gam family protein [Clostridium sp.]
MNSTLLESTLQEQRESFKIENLEGATWAFRKLRAITEKEAEIKDTADKEIEVIANWRDKELEQYAKDKEYFNFLLEEFYRVEKAKDKKFKLSTPYGKVTARKTAKWEYEEETLKDYIRSNDLPFIRVKEEIDKAGLKKCFKDGINTETGEVIPGITIEEVESISVKVE